MLNIDYRVLCKICEKETMVLARGIVAPWIEEMINIDESRRPISASLRSCISCDLSFFDYLYSEDEMTSIYGQYRNLRYFQMRVRWEPWYSSEINNAFRANTRDLVDRTTFMWSLISQGVSLENIRAVVDIGGDRGQFISSCVIDQKYLVETSAVEVEDGVTRVESFSHVPKNHRHLVIVAHVLEHLPNPLEFLKVIRNQVPDDSIIYVEVPLDRPRVSLVHQTKLYFRFLLLVRAQSFVFVLFDFITSFARNYFKRVPAIGIIKMSEHVNYFSEHSLKELLLASGFQPALTQVDTSSKVGVMRMAKIGMLATVA